MHHAQELFVTILRKIKMKIVYELCIKTYMNNIHTGVVCFPDNTSHKLEAGRLGLKGEEVEPFEDAEGCCSPRVVCCCWEPFSTEELEVRLLGRLAAAVVDVDFVNAVVINDHELIAKGASGANTVLTQAVSKLYAETQVFQ